MSKGLIINILGVCGAREVYLHFLYQALPSLMVVCEKGAMLDIPIQAAILTSECEPF